MVMLSGWSAMVLASEKHAHRSDTRPAWIVGTAMRSEPTMFAGRDQVNPRAGRDCAAELYKKAGIGNPRKDFDCAEIYVPFSWFEPMWMENLGFAPEGAGWRMTQEGATALDGDMPINASGGVLSSNPIGASGMLRFAEAALQVRGLAGEGEHAGHGGLHLVGELERFDGAFEFGVGRVAPGERAVLDLDAAQVEAARAQLRHQRVEVGATRHRVGDHKPSFWEFT